jgi:hypothetical protein
MQPITSQQNGGPQRQLASISSIARNAMNLLGKFSRNETPWLLQRCAVLVAATVVSACGAAAQTPDRAITIVVPTTAGTGPDILARTIGEELQRRWNQPVIIVAADEVLRGTRRSAVRHMLHVNLGNKLE